MSTATREDVRLRVVQAADELIAAVGYNRITIEDLANRAGIGKGTIYLHFRSKEEIALATVDRVVDFAYQEMKRIANEPGPAVERRRTHFAREAARALLVGTNSLLPYGLSRRDIDQLEEVKRDAERVIQFLLRALSQAPGDGDTR